MSPQPSMQVRFWGVRGTVAVPGPGTVRYGGNTACVEVNCGARRVIFDGGTGIRAFGDEVVAAGAGLDADILLSHCHLDHVTGLPFFAPFYAPAHRLRLWAGNLLPDTRLEDTLRKVMSAPLFPIGIDTFQAEVTFRDFKAGEALQLGDGIEVRTASLNHPGGVTGYRMECAGRSVTYLTDTEHVPGQLDSGVLALARNADLMIYDSTYTDEEFPQYVGWGHSTWQHAVRIAIAAGAKQVAIFHHDPTRDDAALDAIEMAAKRMYAGALVAREGLTLSL
jgi:phosphoribosyl 1,2-cyclic phosphodiesterase